MPRKLKPFGDGINGTIDLAYLTGYLESLIQAEEEIGDLAPRHDGTPRERRLDMAYDALELLYQAGEFEA